MSETRKFYAPKLDLDGLGQALSSWFQGQNYDVQVVEIPGGDKVLQARRGGWRRFPRRSGS